MPESSTANTYFPDEVAMALCVYGTELDPTEVTKLLGAEPTHAHRRGERKTLRSPPWEKGAWIREVRRFEPVDPDAMFEELFVGLSSEQDTWRNLASRFQLRVDFAVHTDVGCTLALSPHIVQRIAALGAELQLYIQAYGDNDA